MKLEEKAMSFIERTPHGQKCDWRVWKPCSPEEYMSTMERARAHAHTQVVVFVLLLAKL
jgi:hypothetical protein